MPGFDPSQARDREGQWSGGGGGGSGGAASGGIGGKARAVVNWVKSGDAMRAIAAAATKENAQEAIAVGIQALLSTQADFSDGISDQAIRGTVMNAGLSMSMTTRMAGVKMHAAVNKMIEMRGRQLSERSRRQ